MRVAIHQPHYFPWLGYFDKMAKVNRFVLMDEIQLEDRSYMLRNRFLQKDGTLTYLSVTAAKKGYREKKYNEIEVVDVPRWQRKHASYICDLYRKSPYLEEVFSEISPVFEKKYRYLVDVTYDSILSIMKLLNIPTEIVLQSNLNCAKNEKLGEDKTERQSNDVLALCQAAKATAYLTGSGFSLEFLNTKKFEEAGIPVAIQEYRCPAYRQEYSNEFIPNISALDLLLNCGIEESRRLFWENVQSTHEFDRIEA